MLYYFILLFKNFYYFILHVFVCGHVCATECTEVRGNTQESEFSLCHVDSENRTRPSSPEPFHEPFLFRQSFAIEHRLAENVVSLP